jgi:hypothetical protein
MDQVSIRPASGPGVSLVAIPKERTMMMREILTAVLMMCGLLASSAAAGWGGWDSCGCGCRSCANVWDGYFQEHHGYGFCSWCANPYGNYADCDSCGCSEQMDDVTPATTRAPAKPQPTASARRYESWPKATALFPTGWSR